MVIKGNIGEVARNTDEIRNNTDEIANNMYEIKCSWPASSITGIVNT